MTIRVTGRSDETRAVVQQQPLTDSVYVAPQGRFRGSRAVDAMAQPPAPSRVEAGNYVPSPPPSTTHESEREGGPVPTAPTLIPHSPSRSSISKALWTMGFGSVFLFLSLLILGNTDWSSAGSLLSRRAAAPVTITPITDTVQALLFPLDQTLGHQDAALSQLNRDVAHLQEAILAQPSRPTWHWQSAPSTSDNPIISIALEMRGVPVEGKNMLTRLSNLRTGQSVLVVLGPANDHYRGGFRAFRDVMPMRSDMLSLQINDPVYVEWLTDFTVSPTLLTVDESIMQSASADEFSDHQDPDQEAVLTPTEVTP